MEKINDDKLLDIINSIRNAKNDEEAKKILKDNINSGKVVSLIESTLGLDQKKEYLSKETVSEFTYKVGERKKLRDEITSNTNYINWLDKFLYDRESFDNESIKYSDDLNSEDLINIDKLDLLFEAIDNYARGYSIDADAYSKTEDGFLYKINLCDFAFELEVSIGPNVIFFVRKLPYDNKCKYINFKDVIIKTNERLEEDNKSRAKKLSLTDHNNKKED